MYSGFLTRICFFFFFPKSYPQVQTVDTRKVPQHFIAVIVSGLFVDRFMSCFLKQASKLVSLRRTAGCLLLSTVQCSPQEQTPHRLPTDSSGKSETTATSVMISLGPSHITLSSQPTCRYRSTVAPDITAEQSPISRATF